MSLLSRVSKSHRIYQSVIYHYCHTLSLNIYSKSIFTVIIWINILNDPWISQLPVPRHLWRRGADDHGRQILAVGHWFRHRQRDVPWKKIAGIGVAPEFVQKKIGNQIWSKNWTIIFGGPFFLENKLRNQTFPWKLGSLGSKYQLFHSSKWVDVLFWSIVRWGYQGKTWD